MAIAGDLNYSRVRDQEDHGLKPARAKTQEPIMKNSESKEGWVKCLPSKHEALSSNSNTTQKKDFTSCLCYPIREISKNIKL
jgi:hypothetical protein